MPSRQDGETKRPPAASFLGLSWMAILGYAERRVMPPMNQKPIQRTPQKPATLDPIASEILVALALEPAATEIVLGGYFALKHYLDYRETHDIDAWWRTRASVAGLAAIHSAVTKVAEARSLECRQRSFGDTQSFELLKDGVKIFSFQIAVRSVELEPPVASPWAPILIETLSDNVGAKMNALVNRGSPRDFSDIARVVEAGLASEKDCWNWWQKKNPAQSVNEGKQKALLLLQALELRRPLEKIPDGEERQRAEALRRWFKAEFLGG